MAAIPLVFLTGQNAIEHKIRGLEFGVMSTSPNRSTSRRSTRIRILLQKKERTASKPNAIPTPASWSLADMGAVTSSR
jgi:hypothetical protein